MGGQGSEDLQLVKYPEKGHYACHHDSSPDSIQGNDIRLGTLGMFLNDVPKGGETAFPAGLRNDTKGWSEDQWGELENRCQPAAMCTGVGGLIIPAVKGDAILWYNVKPAAIPQLLSGKYKRGKNFGERTLQWSSVHCGAPVLEGEKWFANLWFRPPSRSRAK